MGSLAGRHKETLKSLYIRGPLRSPSALASALEVVEGLQEIYLSSLSGAKKATIGTILNSIPHHVETVFIGGDTLDIQELYECLLADGGPRVARPALQIFSSKLNIDASWLFSSTSRFSSISIERKPFPSNLHSFSSLWRRVTTKNATADK
mmetsp:Transcript_45264/g.117152  ORF Transcript_45264/g.117152 Transcript_45264/m.117152 type:complete len:151 (-) Transcript_45264:1064-1516(-)